MSGRQVVWVGAAFEHDLSLPALQGLRDNFRFIPLTHGADGKQHRPGIGQHFGPAMTKLSAFGLECGRARQNAAGRGDTRQWRSRRRGKHNRVIGRPAAAKTIVRRADRAPLGHQRPALF